MSTDLKCGCAVGSTSGCLSYACPRHTEIENRVGNRSDGRPWKVSELDELCEALSLDDASSTTVWVVVLERSYEGGEFIAVAASLTGAQAAAEAHAAGDTTAWTTDWFMSSADTIIRRTTYYSAYEIERHELLD